MPFFFKARCIFHFESETRLSDEQILAMALELGDENVSNIKCYPGTLVPPLSECDLRDIPF